MGMLATWLFGEPLVIPGFGMQYGSFVFNATTLHGIWDLLELEERTNEAAGGRVAEPVVLRNAVADNIERDKVATLHVEQLRDITLQSMQRTVTTRSGLIVTFSGTDEISAAIFDLVRRTGRRRPHPARVAALFVWLIPAAAIGLLIWSITAIQDLPLALGLGILALLAVAVSILTMIAVGGTTKPTERPTIIKPFTFRDAAARQATVWVAIGAAVGGAVVGAVLTWMLSRP